MHFMLIMLKKNTIETNQHFQRNQLYKKEIKINCYNLIIKNWDTKIERFLRT